MKNPVSPNFASDDGGHFGEFGGRFAPEMLMPALIELEEIYKECQQDEAFQKEFFDCLKTFSGRPTPLLYAENLSKHLGGAKIYLKQEGLGQTGSHKINNAIGQALLTKRMGKKRVIAETGAGQHGFATATVCAKFGLQCEIFMGAVDIKRQRPNVFWMEQLGAKVHPVEFGQKTLKDAVNAALKDWITNVETTHYLLGSALGPHPYPSMVRDFQSVIGIEIKQQVKEAENKLPDTIIACVGGGSNSMGAFNAFLHEDVQLIGIEAGGKGLESNQHAIRFKGGKVGVVEAYKSFFLQDEDGQLKETHSIAAGLDYPGVGPQLAHLQKEKRVSFEHTTDDEVVDALKTVMKYEGIIPALESSHAIAHTIKIAPTLPKDHVIVTNVSGRGDKDIFLIAQALKDDKWFEFLQSQLDERNKNE
ncbi:MAG: tryptophan synthase subunit beta [Planctomycetota bacterium]|nr:MAG: tryptophan synthase subunit beta [Planctomycetota bacterium]